MGLIRNPETNEFYHTGLNYSEDKREVAVLVAFAAVLYFVSMVVLLFGAVFLIQEFKSAFTLIIIHICVGISSGFFTWKLAPFIEGGETLQECENHDY